MVRRNKITLVIDTNLWISFLIGKRAADLMGLLKRPAFRIAVSEASIKELEIVAGRDKFRKYFPLDKTQGVINFLREEASLFEVDSIPDICRDPKDNFLLALSEKSKARFLISGDQDLLVLENYKGTRIVTLAQFFDTNI